MFRYLKKELQVVGEEKEPRWRFSEAIAWRELSGLNSVMYSVRLVVYQGRESRVRGLAQDLAVEDE